MLSDADRDLLARRRRSLARLDLVTWLLPLMWLAGIVFACLRFPALVDPIGVGARLDAGQLEWAVQRTMMRMTPVLFVLLLVFVTVVLIGFLRMLHRERRLLDLVDRAAGGSVTRP